MFNKSGNYFVELNDVKELIVTAEDNILSGNFTETPSDSIKMANIHLTDVCCNSDTAKALFDFFDVPVKYTQQGNFLSLSSEKAVVELMK